MISLKFLRFASPGKLASRLSTGKGSVWIRDVTWTPRYSECAPQKSQTSNKMELNWRVGDWSRLWGEGKLPLSMTQVYNGKCGGWQSDQAFCSRLLSVHSRTPKTCSVLSMETPKTGEIRDGSPHFHTVFRARFALNVIKHSRHCLFKRVEQKKLCKR